LFGIQQGAQMTHRRITDRLLLPELSWKCSTAHFWNNWL